MAWYFRRSTKSVLMRKYFYAISLLISFGFNAFSQKGEKIEVSPEMRAVFKKMLLDFIKEPSKQDSIDDVYSKNPCVFISGRMNDEIIQKALNTFRDSLKLKPYISDYSYGDSFGNDFDFISIEVKGQYLGPALVFRNGDPVKNGLRAFDSAGKSLMKPDAEILKFSRFKAYPYTTINEYDGKFNEMLLLKKVPKGKIKVKGTMVFSYPAEIKAMEFTKADIGITKELNGIKATLIKIENGCFLIQWGEGNPEFMEKIALNKEGYRFNGISSSSMDVSLYEKAMQRSLVTDSAQIDAILNEYEPTMDMNVPMVVRYKVPGELQRLIFYTASKEMINKECVVELNGKF